MRPREDELIDPEIAERLAAIDATLAGDPVDPRFAELAELALMVAAVRPEGPTPEFAAELDRRVAGGFGRPEASAAGGVGVRPARRWSSWGLVPGLGVVAAAVVALVVVVVAVGSGGGSRPGVKAGPAVFASPSAPAHVRSLGAEPAVGAGRAKALAPTAGAHLPARGVNGAAVPPSQTAPAVTTAAPPTINGTGGVYSVPAPAPLPNGRRITQSSILALGTPPRRLDAVAQEVFNEVRAVDGIVVSSNVSSTGGPGASAQFQLKIPSQNLQDALSTLSRLPYASVISRTDSTQDVNNSYLSLQRQIAAAHAALTRLRVKLAAATTDSEIATLRAQIAAESATLSRDLGSLTSLNRKITFSDVYLTVEATTGAGHKAGGGGFGLHQAGHDALRVLEVTAGVALIVVAALLPLGLVVALGWWAAEAARRRRRERALDAA